MKMMLIKIVKYAIRLLTIVGALVVLHALFGITNVLLFVGCVLASLLGAIGLFMVFEIIVWAWDKDL